MREIDFQRHNRHPFFFGRFLQLQNFFFVEQKLARAQRINVKLIALCIRGNIDVRQQRFAIVNRDKTVCDLNLTGANGFDFCTGQRNAGLKRFGNRVVKPRLAVNG